MPSRLPWSCAATAATPSRTKKMLRALGHRFIPTKSVITDEEGGVFVDGAYLSTKGVIHLATMSEGAREQRLAGRRERRDVACEHVLLYMRDIGVTWDQLVMYGSVDPVAA